MTALGLILAAALAQPTPAAGQDRALPAAEMEEPEIVIRAVRGKCRIQLDNRAVSDRELSARAGEWAALGTPVRVIAPDGASYKCLAKITFKLNDKGVRLIRFVDRDEAP